MKIIQAKELSELTTKNGGTFEVNNVESAYSFCKHIAAEHYENFPVGSFLIPAKFRKHFFSIYAFARIADDIADESGDKIEDRIKALDDLNNLLTDKDFKEFKKGNPVLMALHNTLKDRQIPYEPLQKLLIAFKRDILFKQPESYEELEDYCSYSANPVGEFVLRIFGLYDELTADYSNKICTGLQLVNFWQDLSLDLPKNRCYIPVKVLQKYGLNKENLHDNKNSAKLLDCLCELYNYTGEFLSSGSGLIEYLKYYRLKAEINATIKGGQKILNELRNTGTNVLYKRPSLSKSEYLIIILKSLIIL